MAKITRTQKPQIFLPSTDNQIPEKKEEKLTPKLLEPTLSDLPPKHIAMNKHDQEKALDDVKQKKTLDRIIKEYEQFLISIDEMPKEIFSMYLLSDLDKKLDIIKLTMGKKFNKSGLINYILYDWLEKNYPLITASEKYKNLMG